LGEPGLHVLREVRINKLTDSGCQQWKDSTDIPADS